MIRRLPALALLLSVAPGAVEAAERRCGWLANPTPGNFWLTDRAGTWTLSEQGSPGAPGMDLMPDMTTRGWVRMNGPYGYGCACMDVDTDMKAMRITRLLRAEPIPLSRCENDPALRSRPRG